MKTKKVEKVITTLKDWICHPLKRHLTETLTQVNNLKACTCSNKILSNYDFVPKQLTPLEAARFAVYFGILYGIRNSLWIDVRPTENHSIRLYKNGVISVVITCS